MVAVKYLPPSNKPVSNKVTDACYTVNLFYELGVTALAHSVILFIQCNE